MTGHTLDSSPDGLMKPRHAVVRLICVFALVLAGACGDRTSVEALVASAKELSAKKEHAAALIQFRAAVQKSPDSPELRLLLGKALLAAGDAGGAELEFNRALEAKVPPQEVLPYLAQTLVLLGENKKLVQAHAAVSFADPEAQAAMQTQLATAWAALGDRAKAEGALGRASAAVPGYAPAALLSARFLAGKREFAEATKLVDGVVSRVPTDHQAWLLRGELLSAGGDVAGAEQAFAKAIALEKEFLPAYQALVAVHLAKGDVAAAKALAAKLRALAPGNVMTAYVDAQVAFAAGDYLKARDLSQRLLLAAPDNVRVLMLAAVAQARLGAVAQASAHFGKVVSMSPDLAPAREGLAETYIRMGQPVKALEVLKPVLDGDVNNIRAIVLAADAELRQGHMQASEKLYIRAATLDPKNTRLQAAALVSRLFAGDSTAALADLQTLANRTQDTYAEEALFAARLRRGEFDAALASLDAMSKKRPGLAVHQELRGRVLASKRDWPAARAAFEQALKADPSLFAALQSLVSLDLRDKEPARAIARLRTALVANPQDAMALLLLAEVAAGQGTPQSEVKVILADAVKAAPSMVEPRLAQLSFALRLRQFKDALAFAQEALSAIPGSVELLRAAGSAQLQAGDSEQALRTFRKLAGALPMEAGPYLNMAEAYVVSGKPDQAENSLNKALELEPDNEAAQSALVNLLASRGRGGNAMEYVRRQKQNKPKASYPYALEAGLLAKANDSNGALAVLRDGVAKTQSSDLARRLYGAQMQFGRKAEAQQFASTWMKQHPQDQAMEYQIAAQDILRGDLVAAEERLKRVVVAYPTNTQALNNLAWTLVQNGRPREALLYIQQAVQIAPEAAVLLDTMAQALAANKQVSQALDVQRRAVELAPEDNQLRLGLARIAKQSGDKSLAQTELQRLRDLGAKFPAQEEVSKLLQGM